MRFVRPGQKICVRGRKPENGQNGRKPIVGDWDTVETMERGELFPKPAAPQGGHVHAETGFRWIHIDL